MAKFLYVTEFRDLSIRNAPGPVPQEPAEASQKSADFTSAHQEITLGAHTNFLRLITDTDCHVSFGTAPVEDGTGEFLKAGIEYLRGVAPSSKVSVL